MRCLLCCLALLLSTPAISAESRVVEACTKAAAHAWAMERVYPEVVQDFSELSPPRARIKFSFNPGGSIGRTITCEFASATGRLGLLRFSVDEYTFAPEGPLADRFEEVQTLLEREGY